MTKIIVNGSAGKMGAETVHAIENEPGLELVARLDAGDDLVKSIQHLRTSHFLKCLRLQWA